ncbi:MAG TPA: response regulator transcription factor [Nitrospinota bacterium]|nr:response regulator transcription factor [Nitrospinota bacterium]
MSIEVIIGDDHNIVREGIKEVIERKAKDIKVIGEASNGNEILNLAKTKPADVYIIDITMPILNGIETTDRLVRMNPKSKIIILSMHNNRSLIERAFKYGAKGYILKESDVEEVIHAIREVYMNRFFLSSKISKFVVHSFLGKKHSSKAVKILGQLTRREREILQLIGEGFDDQEIAMKLNVSLHTAHAHRKSIMRKLDLHKQADLIRYALKEGICKL